MSEWRDEINRKALARLDKALPEVFPPPVLTHAMGRRFAPPRAPARGKERRPGGMDMAAC